MDTGRGSTGRVTLRDVAAAAGVSFKTVSRVVNDEPRVAPETARRVKDAIRELGFRPDQAARNLRLGQRVHLAGLIVSDLANPHVTALAQGIEQTVRTGGHMLVMVNADEDHDAERVLIEDLLARNVEGLVVVPSGSDHSHLSAVASRVPLVLAHRPVDGVDSDVVVPDDLGASCGGVAELLAAGHRRIAFVGDRPFIHNIEQRLAGFRQAHDEAGVAVDDDLVIMGSHDAESARSIVDTLLSRDDPPTAVFASNNVNCLGALVAISRSGAEVGILGFDEVPLAEYLGVPVTLLTYDQRELGRIAGDLLMQRLGGLTSEARRVVLPVRSVALNADGHSPV